MSRRRKSRMKLGRIKAGKVINTVEDIGEGLARFGGAVPVVGGVLQAAGNALDIGAEKARGVSREIRKLKKKGKKGVKRELEEAVETVETVADLSDAASRADAGAAALKKYAGPAALGLLLLGGLALRRGR